MTKSEYARHRGITRQAVNGLVKRRHLPVEENGSIDPVKADAHLKKYRNPIRGGVRKKS